MLNTPVPDKEYIREDAFATERQDTNSAQRHNLSAVLSTVLGVMGQTGRHSQRWLVRFEATSEKEIDVTSWPL